MTVFFVAVKLTTTNVHLIRVNMVHVWMESINTLAPASPDIQVSGKMPTLIPATKDGIS